MKKRGYCSSVKGHVGYLICHSHASESLDGSQLHRQCGCRLSHALQQGVLYSRVSNVHCISHVANDLDGIV